MAGYQEYPDCMIPGRCSEFKPATTDQVIANLQFDLEHLERVVKELRQKQHTHWWKR
jgi:hypothetical protein